VPPFFCRSAAARRCLLVRGAFVLDECATRRAFLLRLGAIELGLLALLVAQRHIGGRLTRQRRVKRRQPARRTARDAPRPRCLSSSPACSSSQSCSAPSSVVSAPRGAANTALNTASSKRSRTRNSAASNALRAFITLATSKSRVHGTRSQTARSASMAAASPSTSLAAAKVAPPTAAAAPPTGVALHSQNCGAERHRRRRIERATALATVGLGGGGDALAHRWHARRAAHELDGVQRHAFRPRAQRRERRQSAPRAPRARAHSERRARRANTRHARSRSSTKFSRTHFGSIDRRQHRLLF
jgi:hypothetical protein